MDLLSTASWTFAREGSAILATLQLDASPEAEQQRRRLYHDYVAAMRTLRYLAPRALQGDAGDAKHQALERHFAKLEALQKQLLEPLLNEAWHEQADDA